MPDFAGFRKVGWEEEIPPSALLVIVNPGSPRYEKYRNPRASIELKKTAQDFRDMNGGEFHRLYSDWYPYHKTFSYVGMPDGIRLDAAKKLTWNPLPDDEPMRAGDVWFYTAHQERDDVVDEDGECVGRTPLQWNMIVGGLMGWPYRNNCPWFNNDHLGIRPKIQNPENLRQPLPLP